MTEVANGSSTSLDFSTNITEIHRRIKAGIDQVEAELRAGRRAVSTESERIRDATRRIGVRPFGEIDREIRQLRRDYDLLARSGQFSARELGVANQRMRRGIAELRAEQSGLSQAVGEARFGLLGLAAAGAVVVSSLSRAGARSLEFSAGMAEVSTLIEATPAQMRELGDATRDVAVAMGQDAVQSTRALYDILSAGVPRENSIAVLEQSARAAVAGVTDTQTAARAGIAVINAYGREIGELPAVYDVLFQTIRSGVTTLPELAANLGQVLPIAANAGVAFEQVAAAIAEMTKAGIRTPQAITALRGAIVSLSTPTPQAAAAMEELGIQWDGLIGTLRQVAALDLGPALLREIIPEVEARTAVAALTRDVDALSRSVEQMEGSAGAASAAYDKIADTPAQRVKRMRAEIDELVLSLGDLATGFVPVIEGLTATARWVTELPGPLRSLLAAIAAAGAGTLAWHAGLSRVASALVLATGRSITLAGALRAMPWAAAAMVTASFVAEVMRYHRTLGEIAGRQQTFLERQREIMAANAAGADAQRESAAALRAMTAGELRDYRARIEAAQRYHRAQRDLLSTQQAGDDPTAAPSEAAIAAAREARELRDHIDEIDALLDERESTEATHARRIAQIKEDERAEIEQALARQLEAYEAAQRAIEAAAAERERIETRFADFVEGIRQAAAGASDVSFLSVAALRRQAQQALDAGDVSRAIDLADEAREALERLTSAGGADLGDVGLARQIEATARAAAAAQQQAAEASAAQIEETIAGLVERAEFLKRIEIGFDEAAAFASTEALRDELQRRLDAEPLTIPVSFAAAPNVQPARDLLESIPGRARGGLIDGPGGPTSDSVLLRGSRGEYVVRAAAVRHYGLGAIDAINRMALPRFAGGGLIDGLDIPAPAPAPAASPGAGGGDSVYLDLGGRRHELRADPDTTRALKADVRREAAKRGLRR